jgi:hypothetical protein
MITNFAEVISNEINLTEILLAIYFTIRENIVVLLKNNVCRL